MKQIRFIVWFANENYDAESVEVYAQNQDEAVILAKAARIQDGKDYTLYSITELGRV